MEGKVELRVHHGGVIQLAPSCRYTGTLMNSLFMDIDYVSYLQIVDSLKTLGYTAIHNIMYLIPNMTMSDGLRVLQSNESTLEVIGILEKFGTVELFVEAEGGSVNTLLSEEATEETNAQRKKGKRVVIESGSSDEDYYFSEESDDDDSCDEADCGSENEELISARAEKRAFMKELKKKMHIDPEVQVDAEKEQATHTVIEQEGNAESNVPVHDDVSEREWMSDYETDVSKESSDSENEGRRRRSTVYDSTWKLENIVWRVGTLFQSRKEFQNAIRTYGIINGYNLKWKKSESKKMQAWCRGNCEGGCPWTLYAAKRQRSSDFVIKSIGAQHTCTRTSRNGQATAEWIAEQYMDRFKLNLEWPIKEVIEAVQQDFHVQVTKWICLNARKIAKEAILGSVESHYKKLRSYCLMLKKTYPGGTFQLEVDRPDQSKGPLFQRFYICFPQVKQGFLEGCRRIIGLDGCFLKTYLKGQLLTAVSIDANNQMYPLAWAVVEGENESSWSWFIQLLSIDVDMNSGEGFTLISDQQKGLMNALMNFVPLAEHRNCARHIYSNWKKTYRGYELKGLFWSAVKTTYETSFWRIMDEMKLMSVEAYNDFIKIGPDHFCRAFIRESSGCEMTDNNISECFNAWLCRARVKHIIDMLEDIRQHMCNRMLKMKENASKCVLPICPRINQRLELVRQQVRNCEIVVALEDSFEVKCFQETFVVDLKAKSCDCRQWNLTGIPCIHGLHCITYKRYDPMLYVSPWYSREKWMKCYEKVLGPMSGEQMWPKAVGDPILPPLIKKMPGRPKKIRKRDEGERLDKPSKKGVEMSCSICKAYGHNKKRCPRKDNPPPRAPKLPGKPGRPRKQTGQTSTPSSRPTTSSRRTSTSEARDIREASRGFGVYVNEETGNTVVRLPGQQANRADLNLTRTSMANTSQSTTQTNLSDPPHVDVFSQPSVGS